jgi:lysophospholipase L1-like esterase
MNTIAYRTALAGCLLAVTALPPAAAAEPASALITIPVDSPAFAFSPGNWTGDDGRAGKVFRQTWYPYAYVRVAWESPATAPQAKLLLDTSTFTGKFNPPMLACQIDGVWKSGIACAAEIAITGLAATRRHDLTVCMVRSDQAERWGSDGVSGLNVLRVTGLQVDAGSTPVPGTPKPKWALIVGDSITEGCGGTELAGYSYLVGRALQTQGYEFGISACGWSGWLNRGDKPPGDVPGYYVVRNSAQGAGGQYDDAQSRWNKIDGNRHSLLDAKGRLSAYGQTGQEPALILINYGTNDALHGSNKSDTQASIVQCLAALRASAPDAHIVLIVPFGCGIQYFAGEIQAAVEAHRAAHPEDRKVAVIDLGPGEARNLDDAKNSPRIVLPPGEVRKPLMGGLHPNDRGFALFAAQIIPQVMSILGTAPAR